MAFEVEAVSDLTLADGRPLGVINATTLAAGDIGRDPQVQSLVREMSRWVDISRPPAQGGMFDRQVYVPPDNPYDQMRTARRAVLEDDIVGGVADATEAIAFSGGLKWESSDPDDADVFNQMAADLDLDGAIRAMWRESFAIDQFVCAKLWGWKDFVVRGKTLKGNQRKKRYRVWCPTRLVLLNSEFIVPVGVGPLREDRLAWNASPSEFAAFDAATSGDILDPLMSAFFTGRHVANADEAARLTAWRIPSDVLLDLNPGWVFRHCHTKPDYAAFPDLRLRSVFPLLDLKRQLMASDRAALIGAANYILLIRKGNDAAPATQDEVNNLKRNYNFLAKLPVIISDHRLEIDVIAPKLDFVLKADAYDILDHKILIRTLASFLPPRIRSLDPASWNDLICNSVQSRRHMIKRTLETQIARAVVEHPRNAGLFAARPSLVFTPRTVTIGTDQNLMSALLTLRTQRELSRDTILEHLGLDEATEAQRLELEEQVYDPIFRTQVPFASPAAGGAPDPGTGPVTGTPNGTPESPSVAGRRGGRPSGGGTTPASPKAATKPKTRNGNPSTTKES